jgi:hypothetical protein
VAGIGLAIRFHEAFHDLAQIARSGDPELIEREILHVDVLLFEQSVQFTAHRCRGYARELHYVVKERGSLFWLPRFLRLFFQG